MPGDEPDLYTVFVHPLHQAGVRYMIVGSVASMHYGEPRFTMDVDLVVHLDEPEIATITATFPEADYYVPPAAAMAEEIRRSARGHFNLIHLPTGLKADFYPSRNHPYWEWSWAHRRCDIVEGHSACFAPPEYVILSKLEFYREGGSEKHLRDIRSMLAVSGDEIDRALLERAVAEFGLTDQWARVVAD
ncbi:MAG: hypothetical protein Q7S40_06940 [Opitutaceae bacterium]|nr:hypothetical protein [Opitutaceae bacterium]